MDSERRWHQENLLNKSFLTPGKVITPAAMSLQSSSVMPLLFKSTLSADRSKPHLATAASCWRETSCGDKFGSFSAAAFLRSLSASCARLAVSSVS